MEPPPSSALRASAHERFAFKPPLRGGGLPHRVLHRETGEVARRVFRAEPEGAPPIYPGMGLKLREEKPSTLNHILRSACGIRANLSAPTTPSRILPHMLWVFLFTWLAGLPIVERFVRYAQLYLQAVLELLLDETNQPRPLAAADLRRADAGLRRAHALLDMAVWIEACARAGIPHIRGIRAEQLSFKDNPPNHLALFKRALEVQARIDRLPIAAQRWARRMREDPLRPGAARQSTSPGFAGGGKQAALTAGTIASTAHAVGLNAKRSWDRWRSQRDGGGLAIRAPP